MTIIIIQATLNLSLWRCCCCCWRQWWWRREDIRRLMIRDENGDEYSSCMDYQRLHLAI